MKSFTVTVTTKALGIAAGIAVVTAAAFHFYTNDNAAYAAVGQQRAESISAMTGDKTVFDGVVTACADEGGALMVAGALSLGFTRELAQKTSISCMTMEDGMRYNILEKHDVPVIDKVFKVSVVYNGNQEDLWAVVKVPQRAK